MRYVTSSCTCGATFTGISGEEACALRGRHLAAMAAREQKLVTLQGKITAARLGGDRIGLRLLTEVISALLNEEHGPWQP